MNSSQPDSDTLGGGAQKGPRGDDAPGGGEAAETSAADYAFLTEGEPQRPGDVAPAQPAGRGAHIVAPGESMTSIGARYGFFWHTLWNHKDNAELKRARKNPNVLLPGDRVTIPERADKFVSAPTTRTHRFRLRGIPAEIRFIVRDAKGAPFAGKRYKLVVGSAVYEGTTDGDGRIHQMVSPTAKTGEIQIWLDTPYYPEVVKYTLQVSHLEPIESTRGVTSRLNGLGFYCGEADDVIDAAVIDALRGFQRSQSLPVTGEPDDATRARLLAVYGM